MSKVTSYHIGKILDKEFTTKAFTKCESLEDIVEELLENTESFRAPFTISEAYIVKESLPVYNAASLKKGSNLHNILLDAPNEVALVVDSVLSSIDSLHFVAVRQKSDVKGTIEEWLYMARDYNMLVSPFTGSSDYALITKLKTFKKEI